MLVKLFVKSVMMYVGIADAGPTCVIASHSVRYALTTE